MKRRNLIIGMGSFAAAGGAAVGTGAFSTAEATRDVSVQVANENNAYLSIKPSNTANGQFATQGSSGNQIGLDFSGSGNSGSGVGQDSVYNFDDVFRISNQGTQTIYVWSRLSGGSKFDDNNLYFYPNDSRATELNDSSNSVLTLSPGEGAKVGVHVDTESVSTGSDTITATIRADTDKPGNSESVGPDGDEALVVSQNPGPDEFGSIQDAIDKADSTTILVEDGPSTYDEQVTVDTSLTLQGTGQPTVKAPGTADTFEVTADDVTIEGFEIRNPNGSPSGQNGPASDFTGAVGVSVQSGTTGVTVRNNLIAGLGTGNDDANPIAVYAQGETSGITVEDNQIENLEGTDEDKGAIQAILINSQKNIITGATGIDNARIANNVITGLTDTRSTVAVRFNGDVSGEIVGNTISDLNTEGDIPGTNDPGGFTQVISLAQGGNSPTGPSDVTIKNNDISQIETTTPGNFAPPVHLSVGGSTSNVTVTGNNFSADSPDVEIYVQDGSGTLDLVDDVRRPNSFTPDGQVSGSNVFPEDLTIVEGGGGALQNAINNASSGDMLAVDGSTYDPITIDKPLSVQSIFSRPKIDAAGSNPGIAIEASDALVSGFEITGDNDTVAGVSIRTSNGATGNVTIRNNVISGITGAGGGGNVEVSFGILSFGTQKLTDLVVENNVIDTVGRAGTGGPPGQLEVPGFGIQLEEINGARVVDNIVRNMRGVERGPQGQISNYGIGIQPLDDNSVSDDFPAKATVKDNIIEDAKVGIIRGDSTDRTQSTVENNSFNNVSDEEQVISS